MKKLFLIIFVLLTTTGYTQQTLPCTQIGVNNLAGPNPYITGSCLEVSSDLHVNNKNAIMEADNRIHFGAGAHISPNLQGYFHASIRPNALQVAWMEPGSVGSVGKYEKLEIGIKIPDEIQTQIFQFLNSGASAVDINHPGLNPFNPEEVSVEAIFTSSIGNTAFQFPVQRKIDGFWYREFDRTEFSEVYTELSTDYHFRIRFAPPTTGNWRCVIKMYVHGVLTNETSPFQFTVVNSGNPGYVRVGDSKRFLTLGSETYFPIGMNIPNANCHGGQSPCDVSYLDPDNHPFETSHNVFLEGYNRTYWISPLVNDFFKSDLYHMRLSGANTVRFLFFSSGHNTEFEAINNYDNYFFKDPYQPEELFQSFYRSQNAWEFDHILDYADDIGVKLLLNIMYNTPIIDCDEGSSSNHCYSMTLYDWAPDNTGEYNNDIGYCYNRELGLESPLDFLTDETAKQFYKYNLRYIVSRWGYSTGIFSLQLINEFNNTAGVNNISPETNYYYDVQQWQNEMLDYLNELQLPQLSSVSYAWVPANYNDVLPYLSAIDRTFYYNKLSLPTYNHHFFLPSRFEQMFTFRKGWFPSDDEEFSEIYPGFSFDYYKENQMKPLLIAETGVGDGISNLTFCDPKSEWLKELFISPFLGTAGMGLIWDRNYDYTLWQTYFPKIATFLAPYNFNESSGNVKGWMPGHDYVLKNKLYWVGKPHFYESHPEFHGVVDAFYLRSPDKEYAVGIVANRTYNFYTSWTCSNDPFGGDLMLKKTFRGLNDNEENGSNVEEDKPWVVLNDDLYTNNKTVSYDDEKLFIKGLSGNSGLLGKRYTIDFISPWTLNVVATTTDRKGANGVQIKYPDIQGVKETSMYLIRVYPYKDKSAVSNSNDTVAVKGIYREMMLNFQNNQEITVESEIRVYPNPANDCLNIEIPALSGLADISIYDLTGRMSCKKDSYDVLTKIDISSLNPGSFIIKITTGNSTKTIKFVKQ